VAAALPTAAELPDGAGEELRARTYHEQRCRARRRRRCQEWPRLFDPRRSHCAVKPRIGAVHHLAGEHAAAAYGAPTTLVGIIPRILVMLSRQA